MRNEKHRLSLNVTLECIAYVYGGGDITHIPFGATSETWEIGVNPEPSAISIRLQDRLPASVLSEYTASEALQTKLHQLPKSTTVRHLSDFLTFNGLSSSFASVFGTINDRNGLRGALRNMDFQASHSSPRANRVFTDSSDDVIESAYSQILRQPPFVDISASWRNDWRRWLPWTSVEIMTALRRVKSEPLNALRRATFKLAAHCDDGDDLYPWTLGFSHDTASLPVMVVASFSSAKLLRQSLRELRQAGVTSVNDLRCLHPTAVQHAQHPGKPLFHLFQKLNFLAGLES